MKLVIAEKPSVARDIATVIGANNIKDSYLEGNNYIVSWAIGHLVTLQQAEEYNSNYAKWDLNVLPIIPNKFHYKIQENTKKQFDILKELISRNDVDEIICSTDAGREGELIFRLIYNLIGINKKCKRLWISSMTEESIKDGFANLKDSSEYDNLYFSAQARQQADWLVGINATRYYTIKSHSKIPLTAGRVQTPTLNLIVCRDNDIKNFVKSSYYNLQAIFPSFIATYIDSEKSSKLDKVLAEEIKDKLTSNALIVKEIKQENKFVDRPPLYDLTTLQRDSNKQFGFSAAKTLDIAQALYEKHKLTTYPRTDSRYLPNDMIEPFKALIDKIREDQILGLEKYNISSKNLIIDKKVFDNSKISDHHAIIITNKISNDKISNLSEDEKNVLYLILKRMLVVASEKYEYSQTSLLLNYETYNFISQCKDVINLGWKNIETEDKDKAPINSFENLSEGDIITPNNYLVKEIETTPQKPFTEDTLLSAMENCKKLLSNEEDKEFLANGIGTPATRASIIENLIKYKYIIREKKNLIPTEKGINFINICDDNLKSIDITAEWEKKLNSIAEGKYNQQDFINEISSFIINIIKSNTSVDTSKFEEKKEILGICPVCKKNIYAGTKSYYCQGYKDEPKCNFYIYKVIAGKTLTNKNIKDLLTNSKTGLIKGFKSKSGKSFDAILELKDNKINFNFPNSK